MTSLPGVMSMGETEYMLRLFGHFEGWLSGQDSAANTWQRRLGLSSPSLHRRLQGCLDRAFVDAGGAPQLKRRWTGRGYVREFCRVLDERAASRYCTCWVEKTPDHLAYVDLLSDLIPDAHFLHVVRAGEDVIASAIDGQLRYAEHNVFYGTLPYWIRRWNRAARWHVEHAGRERHTVLPFECLFSAGDQVRTMMRTLSGTDAQIVPAATGSSPLNTIADLASEPWKRGSTDGTLRRPQSKAPKLFGKQLREMLGKRLMDYRQLIDELARKQPHLPWIASAAREHAGRAGS